MITQPCKNCGHQTAYPCYYCGFFPVWMILEPRQKGYCDACKNAKRTEGEYHCLKSKDPSKAGSCKDFNHRQLQGGKE